MEERRRPRKEEKQNNKRTLVGTPHHKEGGSPIIAGVPYVFSHRTEEIDKRKGGMVKL